MTKSNILLMTDSYKASHYLQYPQGTEVVSSYIESRGGKWERTVVFGLQMFLKEYLSNPITREDIDEAEAVFKAHGEPFNKEGWDYILSEHGGRLPVRIRAVPEGTVVPTGNVLVDIENTDPKCFWLTSYLETALLRAVWYPTTVATNSFAAKEVVYKALQETADDADAEIMFKVHDFGARGVSSPESAMIGGAAHLVNFLGTDTVEGLIAAKKYYGEDMAGFSIPASEHSTITAWGEDGEVDAMRNMVTQFGGEGKIVACVSDSFDIYNAAKNLWGYWLLEDVKNSGGTLVVRPDSGDPLQVPIKVIEILMEKAGHEVNSKGYKVLPSYFRVIQGDGINVDTIKVILDKMKEKGLSASNIAFGQGGGLLQQVDRDTLKFAMKCSAIKVNGEWRDVYKDPVDQPDKASKRGRLSLLDGVGGCTTVRREECPITADLLGTVFVDGSLIGDTTFKEIRERANEGLAG